MADCFRKPEGTQDASPTTKYRTSIFREIFDEIEAQLIRTRAVDSNQPEGDESIEVEARVSRRSRNLKAARSESWPWAVDKAFIEPHLDRLENSRRSPSPKESNVPMQSNTGFRNLKASRSESWPWSLEQASCEAHSKKVTKRRSEAYIDILHRSSLQGFPAPPRHEINEYQQKPLPSTPGSTNMLSLIDALGTTAPADNPIPPQPAESPRSTANPDSGRRVDSFLGLNVADDGERKRESMLIAPDFEQRGDDTATQHKMQATWISRVSKRAENNQKAHEYLQKRE